MEQQQSYFAASNKDLKHRALTSSIVRLAAQIVQVTIGIGASMLLARLLTPEDFGLFAMVGSLTTFVISFRDFGLPMATIHKEEINQEQMTALFWLNFRLNLILALCMTLLAPVLAWFYGDARLIAITIAMTGGIFIAGLSIQHESLLTRQMRFALVTRIQLVSLIAGALVGVPMGLLGMGYWALVGQFVASMLAQSAGMWFACRWRPSHPRKASRTKLGSMLSYSADLTGFRVLSHIGRNMDTVLVGYFSGSSALGLYQNAYKWSLFPIQQVYSPLLSIAVASLSRVKNDPERYREHARATLLPVFALCMPALAFVFIEAENAILVLGGEQWLPSVPIFQLMCIAAFVSLMSMVTKWLYLSQGETRRQLQWGLIYTPVMIACVAVGTRGGAYGVALGFTIGTCLLTYPSVAHCLKTSHLRLTDFVGIVWRPIIASLLAALITLVVDITIALHLPLLLDLALKAALFGIAYTALWILMPGGRTMTRSLFETLMTLRTKRTPATT